MTISKERFEKLDKTRLDLEKRFGKGITVLGNERKEVPIICSTGSLNVDVAIGVGGLPRGRIVEIYGPEASGKTTLSLHMIAEAQKEGGIAAFVDAEHALDPVWATNIGVNMDELLISQPECGEDALEVVEALVRSNTVDVIIIDSVAALVPKAELEGDMGDSHMGLQARLMSQAMRKLTGVISRSKCTVIFLNQIRHKIGVMFGSPETTTGGNALKFYASLRIEVRRLNADSTSNDKDGMSVAGIKVKIVKNKVAPPFKVTHIELQTGVDGEYGFNKFNEIIDLAVEYELIKKGGAWYTLGEDRFQGKQNLSKHLKEHVELYNSLEKQVIDKVIEDNKPEIGSFNDQVNKEDKKDIKVRKKKLDPEFEEISEL